MNQTMQSILSRRSVKRYKSTPVPDELIEQIVTAGTYAATGRNLQSPIIIAVTDRQTRDKLSQINAKVGAFPEGTDPFYGAPAVLIVLFDKSVRTGVYDGSLVMGNLMLAAHALGLGSCWIHRAKEEFEMPEWREWLKNLGIEGEYEGVGHCVIGYPDGEIAPARPRKEGWAYYVK